MSFVDTLSSNTTSFGFGVCPVMFGDAPTKKDKDIILALLDSVSEQR